MEQLQQQRRGRQAAAAAAGTGRPSPALQQQQQHEELEAGPGDDSPEAAAEAGFLAACRAFLAGALPQCEELGGLQRGALERLRRLAGFFQVRWSGGRSVGRLWLLSHRGWPLLCARVCVGGRGGAGRGHGALPIALIR